MDKDKNIKMELTKEELQRMIERITREIQEAKEEGSELTWLPQSTKLKQ